MPTPFSKSADSTRPSPLTKRSCSFIRRKPRAGRISATFNTQASNSQTQKPVFARASNWIRVRPMCSLRSARLVTSRARQKKYEKGLAIKPDDPDGLYNVANAFQSDKEYEKAIASYQKSLRLRPDSPEALAG